MKNGAITRRKEKFAPRARKRGIELGRVAEKPPQERDPYRCEKRQECFREKRFSLFKKGGKTE